MLTRTRRCRPRPGASKGEETQKLTTREMPLPWVNPWGGGGKQVQRVVAWAARGQHRFGTRRAEAKGMAGEVAAEAGKGPGKGGTLMQGQGHGRVWQVGRRRSRGAGQ